MTDVPALPPRTLGRTDRRVPAVVWELDGPAVGPDILRRCASGGANWLVVPTTLSIDELAAVAPSLPADWSLVLSVSAEALTARAGNAVETRLTALGRERCAAVMLRDVSPDDLKAGRPFHRLARLRDAGRVELFFVDAPDHPTAEWMVEHSPAHAIALRFGIGDQTARYRTLPTAEEYGTGILSRRPTMLAWQPPRGFGAADDIAFCLSQPGVSAVIEPLPPDVAGVERVVRAAQTAVDDAEQLWQAFQQQVPEPKKRRGGHPIDEA